MTRGTGFDRRIFDFLDREVGPGSPDYLDDILVRTAVTRQRPGWASIERWLPMETTFDWRRAPTARYAWLLVLSAVLVALLTVVLAVGSRSPDAEPFGLARNGSVVYTGSDGDIYARDPVTGVTTPLVTGPEVDIAPTFSNDGSRFVFAREAEADRQWQIMMANADGTGVRPLTGPLANLTAWAWSPDGSRLAVSSYDDEWLWILAIDGTKQVLVDSGMSTENLQWRPDGRELVFRGVVPLGQGESIGLYTVRADGTGTRPEAILPPTYSGEHWQNPALSPDGTKIIYTQWDGDDFPGGSLYVVDVDTRKVGRLLFDAGPESDYYARWSPDGSQIVFNRGTAQTSYYLAVGPAGGGTAVQIGPEVPWDSAAVADFSPDGSKVIARYSNGESWIFDVASGASQRLPATNEYIGSWQRRAP